MARKVRSIAFTAVLVVLTLAAASAIRCLPSRGEGDSAAKEGPSMAMEAQWEEVDRLVSEQKIQQALKLAEKLEQAAREAGNEAEITRALVQEMQLRTALHGYETAVRQLRDASWPQAPLQRAVLDLYYARSLVNYLQVYSWEIRQRETVETSNEVDLKTWSADQIYTEAQKAFADAWAQRQDWGAEPLGDLAPYIQQNTYPARIRGTLRDAVSYLWAELLADTSLWRPEQSDNVYRLDLPALMAGDAKKSASLDLADPELHPLERLSAVLGDLEAWHRGAHRPEAAFEAHRTRLEALAQSFYQKDDQQAILADLETQLDRLGRRYEWWSMGMAQQAEMVRSQEAPDALARARRIALDGQEAHPKSPGGQRCQHIVAAIEAPQYRLAAMYSDAPGQRSIEVSHANLEALYFRAFPVDLEQRLQQARDYNLLPNYREVPRILGSQKPVAEWKVALPATPDYRVHRTFVTLPEADLHAPGAYLIVASTREDFAQRVNQRSAVNIILGDLVLVSRTVDDGFEITARSGASGKPLAGVEVSIYRMDWNKGHHAIATRTTGTDGIAAFPAADWQHQQHLVFGRLGGQVTVGPQSLWYSPQPAPTEQSATLIYTDRSIYRPEQDVLWKVIGYRGVAEDGHFRTLPETSMTVELSDANGQVVASEEVTTNTFGSASGRFTIPAGRLLGQWQLRTSLGGATWVQVEEYKRPTFEVSILDPDSPLRVNRPASLHGEARYYFGLPLVSGQVRWQVTREQVLPDWWLWWFEPPIELPQVIASGTAAMNAEGRFDLTFTPAADERDARIPGLSYHYRLSADVTDEGGETRSATRVFRLGFVAIEAKIQTEAGFFQAGQEAHVTILRTDLNGTPRPGAGSWQLLALKQPEKALVPSEQPLPRRPGAPPEPGFHTPGDQLRPRWDTTTYLPDAVMAQWPDGAERGRGTVKHGEDGKAEARLGELPPGAYRLRYTSTDEFGSTCEVHREFVVAAAEGTHLALPAALLAERTSVPVGDTLRLFVHSGLPDQPMVLEVSRAGRRVERRLLTSGRSPQLIELPIREQDRGGFGLALTCLHDHQLMTVTQTILVPWDDKRLQLSFASFRDRLRPGDKETWRVTVRGSDEATLGAGAAEVLAYMYDRSLDLFAPHQPEDPLSLYPSRITIPTINASLGAAPLAWQDSNDFVTLPGYPSFQTDQLKLIEGYGIGGMGRRRGMVLQKSEMRSLSGEALPAPPPEAMMAEASDAPAVQETIVVAGEPAAGEAGGEGESSQTLRSDFAETAFWQPHLLTGEDGSVSFEFTVPDSVTEWNVWLHAITRDLRAGSLNERTRTVKELLVRPYLPRFLREGDRAELKVVVNNAGETPLKGRVRLEVQDPDTEQSLLAEFGLTPAQAELGFEVAPGGGSSVTFPLKTPNRVGTVAFRIVGQAGDLSDGELRPLPVLPGRVHLAQSRFATLHDRDRRSLHFADLEASNDPTRIDEQLVVTLDAQLFYSVLNALPYLVSYPYECTEQTLNRFLSTGIVSSLYDSYPAVARMAKQLSGRETRLEPWNANDPNRKMTLEETPWLVESRGGADSGSDLVNVLDPKITAAQRDGALAKLRDAQTSIGGFPWWPGGPPSPFMTLYILAGFSHGLEFGVEVPQDVVVRAWSYMHRHYLDEMVRDMQREDCCWELVTFLNYVLSSYPDTSWTGDSRGGQAFTDDDRRTMLEFSFRHWRQHSPRLKGYLALTLLRAGRAKDAHLVFDSVMDSARTEPDLGTYWAPEDRAWLWYNDTIESHAFALRALTELSPDDARRHGLVQWLLLNKKLNHWKSTRATAEVIYALVHYLEHEGQLGVREAATVTVGSRQQTFTFEPDQYTGRNNQVVIPGPEIDPKTMSTVVVEKETPGFLFASATWHFSTEQLPAEARGDFFAVQRSYFKRVQAGREWRLQPLADGTQIAPGDQLEGHLSLSTKHAAEYVHLRDPRPAGCEPETTTSGYKWDLGIGWYEEVRDSGTNFFFEWLPAGEYTFKYRLRANLAGTFKVSPATVQSMYAPEFVAYSAGEVLTIKGE